MGEKKNQTGDVNSSNVSDVTDSSEEQSNTAQINDANTDDNLKNNDTRSDLEKAEAKAMENWDLYLRASAEL